MGRAIANRSGRRWSGRRHQLKLTAEGITVNAIASAQIETELLGAATAADPSRIPVSRFGTVDEVAEVPVMLATNGNMTGQTASLNGGLYYI